MMRWCGYVYFHDVPDVDYFLYDPKTSTTEWNDYFHYVDYLLYVPKSPALPRRSSFHVCTQTLSL